MIKKMRFMAELIMLIALILLSSEAYAQVNIAIIDSGSPEEFYRAVSFTSVPANIDPIGHGTKIAKLIKEDSPFARICMLQVCEKINGQYVPSGEAVLRAIEWCAANDMDIVNLSLVLEYSSEIESVIRKAYLNKGLVFIAAAGNKSISNQFAIGSDGYVRLNKAAKETLFPAMNEHVISVGAYGPRGRIADYSQANADVFLDGNYGDLGGTSFACARATAKAAKLMAENPDIGTKELKTGLLQ